jgi:hypothetical protein
MKIHRMIEWMIVAATAGIMILLKELHLGVTHYNLFLLILIGWCLLAIFAFRRLSDWNRSE